ncbi:MAG: glycosyltransferase family 4 protein [Steroidobacteraceae bacterium]
MPAKILYIDGNMDGTVGGSFFSLYYLTQGLDRARYTPVVAFVANHAILDKYLAAGIDTRILPRPAVLSKKWRLPRPLARVMNAIQENLLWPLSLQRFLAAERFDLVHLNNSTTGNHEWMIACLFARVPCVTHERGINRSFSFRSRLLGPRLRAVICISEAVRANFDARHFRGIRLVTIPNGLDADSLPVSKSAADSKRMLGISDAAPLIGMVGNIKAWKGQETLVRAMAILKRNCVGLRCLLIGAVSADQSSFAARLEKLILDLGLSESVTLTGYRKDVADCMNALDVVVHASTEPEPFGRVLLEAMALRKPLVASNAGAVPEIVVDGESGLLFRPGDPVDLARAVERLIRDQALADRLADAGHRRLVERFSIGRNIELTQQLYDSILNTGKSPASYRRTGGSDDT